MKIIPKINNAAYCCSGGAQTAAPQVTPDAAPHRSGCMACGAELVYFATNQEHACYFCGQATPANAVCANGHFVCDRCHSAGAVEIIQCVCLHSRQTDLANLMQTIRAHPRFPIHGPEHHSLVPAVILTGLRNSGQPVTDEQILTAIQRGQTISGGACGFLGACGAAIGVGIAASVLLEATPYRAGQRQTAQRATSAALRSIASYDAPRCCQRDAWLALKAASRMMCTYTGVELAVDCFECEQYPINKECIQERCPLWPLNEQRRGRALQNQVKSWSLV